MTMPVAENAAWLGISVARESSQSLHLQIYDLVRRRIEDGTLLPGSRLPSSRNFAGEVGVARATVTAAYEQLIAEGYVSGRQGSRLKVNDLHSTPSRTFEPVPPAEPLKPPSPMLLTPGIPDLRLFPDRAWMKAATRSWRAGPGSVLGDWDPAGALQLRRAVAGHLREWREITADPDQLLITAGSAGALQLILDTLTSRGDPIAAEEPGYPAFDRLANRRGLELISLPVDREGINIDALQEMAVQPRLCVVTPSHQYPLGGAMSIGRRHRLLQWASTADALIVEDDYDSQFRYDGRPLPALHSIARSDRVIYVGTTSKVLSPAIRIGYIVVPRHLIGRFRDAADNLEQRASIVPQYPLAEMIESGEYARHLRRMRRTYRERRQILAHHLSRTVPSSCLRIEPQGAGLHLLARFGPRLEGELGDTALEARCRDAGLGVKALSSFYRGAAKRHGLMIGFAAFEEEEIARGAARLAELIAAEQRA